MCSVLLIRHYETRKHPAAASWFMTPGRQTAIPEGRTRPAKARHYPVVGAALLWTLEKGLGDGWTPEVADAWVTAYSTLSGYMISEAYGRSKVPSKDIS